MSEPNKVISCQGCLQRLHTRSYVFGHAQCSYHRKCTGGMFWEPRGCPQCNTCLHRMANMTVSQVRDFLTNYRKMLQGVKNKLRRDNPARVWEYECVFPYFFKDYIHFDPARQDALQLQSFVEPVLTDNQQQNHSQTEPHTEAQLQGGETLVDENAGTDDAYDIDPFFGFTGNSTPLYPTSINGEECTSNTCIFGDQYAQCNDPVHTPFTPTQRSKRERSLSPLPYEVNASALAGPSDITFNRNIAERPSRTPTRNYSDISTQWNYGHSVQTPTNSNASGSGGAPQGNAGIAQNISLPAEQAVRHPYKANGVYWVFNPVLHERIGANQMKIKFMDPTNTFPTSYVSNVIYKPGNNNLFETTTEVPSHLVSPYIRADAARAAFMAGFQLPPSTADLGPRSTKKFLDSDIPSHSGLNALQQELQSIDLEVVQTASGMKESDIIKLFSAEGFQAVNFVNFTGGWILTPEGFNKFAKDANLNLKTFQYSLLTCDQELTCQPIYLATERETKMNFLHSLTTLHFQELLTGKLELIPEEIRVQTELSPDLSRGICRMQLVQIKHNIAKWMIAKMRVRRDVLKDSTNANVRWMYKQTLWDPEIFPKDAITKLRAQNNNTVDVASLLGIKSRQQPQNNSGNNNTTVNINRNKRQRTNSQQFVPNTRKNVANTYQKKGGNDQKTNNNKANGQNNAKPFNQGKKTPGKKGNKSFPNKNTSGNSQ